jgi:hypothetical protein
VQALGGDVLGREADVGRRPAAGDHDGRRDSAELAGDRFVQAGCPGGLGCHTCGRGSPDDGVVGGLAASEVYGVDSDVRYQVAADRRVTGDDAQVAALHEQGRTPRAAPAAAGR